MSIDFQREETISSISSSHVVSGSSLTISKGGLESGGDSPTLQTTGAQKTGVSDAERVKQNPTHGKAIKVQPRIRQRCRLLFGSCIDSLQAAVDNSDNFFVRNNALGQLKESLEELWAISDTREEPFAEIVNVLQGVLLEKNVESLEDFEVEALERVFLRLHGEPIVDDIIVSDLILSLVEAGVDVFRPIE